MSIRRIASAAVCVIAGSLASAEGGDLFQAMVEDFQEVNQWPCPYSCWDREAVTAQFPTMIQNGWRRQNVFTDYHFVGLENKLSPAGQYKVRWILTAVPLEYRTMHVRRAETPEQTAARVEAIRKYAAVVAPDAGPPSILETNLGPVGYPAGWPGSAKEESSIARKFQPFVPDKIFLPQRKADDK